MHPLNHGVPTLFINTTEWCSSGKDLGDVKKWLTPAILVTYLENNRYERVDICLQPGYLILKTKLRKDQVFRRHECRRSALQISTRWQLVTRVEDHSHRAEIREVVLCDAPAKPSETVKGGQMQIATYAVQSFDTELGLLAFRARWSRRPALFNQNFSRGPDRKSVV